MTISFAADRYDRELIRKIARRAVAFNSSVSLIECEMDVIAVHANGCRLNLQGLLATDDFNFVHDVFGIRQNLDRETGALTNCFLPRFAIPE